MTGDQVPPSRATPVLDRLLATVAAQAGAENFPVALRVLPRGPRDKLSRVYGYARFVDDIGDEASGDRLALLDLVEHDVRALWSSTSLDSVDPPRLPIIAALGPVLDDGHMPIQPFLDLIEANRVDQRVHSYPDFDALLGYCRLSAAPVGRIVLHIAHAADDRNIADADAVCAALQVLEHCQDVGEDAAAGRVYLPADELAAAGVAARDLSASQTSAPLRHVLAAQVERALELLRPGRGLVRRLTGWSRVAVAGYVAGGLATADTLRAHDFDVLAASLGPSKLRTATHALRLIAGR
ncbi:MAG TPA: squalene synthase HpnC [Jatrophihabitantaceae bacterium]|jgi:squalene synthase HpnC|nr:squalene synthase HpnC [Jatrophihabitantaceae bacterium]